MPENPLSDLGHEAGARGPGGVPVWGYALGLAGLYVGYEWWKGRGTAPASPAATDAQGSPGPDAGTDTGGGNPVTQSFPVFTGSPGGGSPRPRKHKRGVSVAPQRQRPKRSKRAPRREARQDMRQEARQDARQESRIDQRMNARIANNSATAGLGGGTGVSSGPSAGSLPTTPGTTGTSVETPTDYTYSWAPEGERHAVTTNMEPDVSWPPVDLPPLSGYTTDDLPIDNGQADPETVYGQFAGVTETPYNDYDETGYPG